jgi:CubicO group peptidase (beta-lactamase class C family)
VHNQGSFNSNTEIKSARKSFHAATIGALIEQGKIDSVYQLLSDWNAGVVGGPGNCHIHATVWHAMTQTTAFDEPGLCPGEAWVYSDANPPLINRVAARAWRGTNATDYSSNYKEVIGGALLNRTGASGWSTSVQSDGIRLSMDLEDLGRFGLLMVNSDRWNGVSVVPEWFVEELSTKQAYGIPPNFDNANDGHTELREEDFPSGSPYGCFTW